MDNGKNFSSDLDTLRKLVPLADLPDYRFEELIKTVTPSKGVTGSVLFNQGDVENEFVYLLEGQIELRIGDIPLQIITAGTSEASFALAHQFPRRASAVAVTPVSYLRVPGALLANDRDNRILINGKHSDFAQANQIKPRAANKVIASILNPIESVSETALDPNKPVMKDREPLITQLVQWPTTGISRLVKKLWTANAPKVPESHQNAPDSARNAGEVMSVLAQIKDDQDPTAKADPVNCSVDDRTTPNSPRAPGKDRKPSDPTPTEGVISEDPAAPPETAPKNFESPSNRSVDLSHPPPPERNVLKAIRLISSRKNESAEFPVEHDPKMALIPGKALTSLYDSKTVLVSAFLLEKTPVTNREYLRYVEECAGQFPEFWGSKGPRKDELDHPVTGISLQDARKYATWCGKRLPTIREWEAAARPIGQFRFPWGDNWDSTRCNGPDLGLNATTPVNRFSNGASPEGCLDLVGNVWEWCEQSENDTLLEPSYGWVYGGSYRHACLKNDVISRTMVLEENRYDYLGFRCAKSIR